MDKSTEAIFWLKEFSKSRVHIVSNKIVYQEQVCEPDSGRVIGMCGGGTYIEAYLSCNLWLEILFKIRRRGEFEFYIALVEASETVHKEKLIGARQASGDGNSGHTRKNNAMFVNVINSRENPERMPSPLPIRSVIRLHRLDVSPDVIAKAFESPGEFRTFLNVDWEGGESITLDGERPSDVIKGGTQSVRNLSNQKPPRWRESVPKIRAKDIAAILRVSINSTSVRLTCDEGFNFSVEDIKVFLRPIDSSEGVSHWLHMLSLCE